MIDILKTVCGGKESSVRAASVIASIYDPAVKSRFSLSPVIELWGMICEATKQLGGDQEI